MLCENCPALRCEGYEYPEEYCLIQPEENWRDFKEGAGCCLSEKTIRKRVEKAEEMESLYYEGMAKAYALDCLEQKTDELSKYMDILKECLGLFAYNCPKSTKRGQKTIYRLIRNKVVTNRIDKRYSRYRELELCGLMYSDISRQIDYDPLKKPNAKDSITFWLTKDGFRWLSEKDTHGCNFVEYKFLQGPVEYLNMEHKKQIETYAEKGKIAVGDMFVWRRAKKNTEYISSGKLREKYIYSPDFPYAKQGVLEVYKVYEGENGYGPFMDYYLKLPNASENEYHIIINGVDAMKMQRANIRYFSASVFC